MILPRLVRGVMERRREATGCPWGTLCYTAMGRVTARLPPVPRLHTRCRVSHSELGNVEQA